MMADGQIQLIINTPTRTGRLTDEGKIRAAAIRLGVPIITTTTGAAAAVRAIKALRFGDWKVAALQDYLDFNNGKTETLNDRKPVGV
jgi:carbamoyl-phosphate synthase large subunit